MEQLSRVVDPELGRSIVELGLVYAVEIQDEQVAVRMTLTTPGCPMRGPITDGVRRVLQDLSWVKTATMQLVWEPRWTPERIAG
jgi:metal-sulfur cluster biosynthetic enzyme